MPPLNQNNIAVLLRHKLDIESPNVIEKLDYIFKRFRSVLDSELSSLNPQILLINNEGIVDPNIHYDDLHPSAAENKLITYIHQTIKHFLIRFLDENETYEGPALKMIFDECIEGESPYESPIFIGDEFEDVGLIFESEDELEGVENELKEALKALGENGLIEIVDWSGEYKFFE